MGGPWGVATGVKVVAEDDNQRARIGKVRSEVGDGGTAFLHGVELQKPFLFELIDKCSGNGGEMPSSLRRGRISASLGWVQPKQRQP